jgi:hypothetical protein
MKKIIITLALLSALTAGAFGQTDGMLNINEYSKLFLNNNGRLDRQYRAASNSDDYNMIAALGGEVTSLDTPLEIALLSTCAGVAEIRPAQANRMLGNARQADQKLGAAVFQEIQVLRFLGDTAAVNRHEAVLQYITGRGNATRAEIETFYRNNIRALVSQVVDQEFRGITVPAATVTYVKNSLSNFYTTPNQTNFNELNIILVSLRILPRNCQLYNMSSGLLDMARERGWDTAEHINTVRQIEAQVVPAMRAIKAQFPENTDIMWYDVESAYQRILNGFNPELVRRMR